MSLQSLNPEKIIAKHLFQEKLRKWYLAHHRKLPWRENPSPYQIWLSEIILQQTRVVQGHAYYHRLLKTFPTIHHLARAEEQEILRVWQGLGYYTRARNLHACAKKVVENHRGAFPKTYKELLALPGIGPYTAAAIASIAFEEPLAVVDGNVYRFLARLFGIEKDITLTATKRMFQELANFLLPQQDIGIHNQGMMEFGALICTPQSPICHSCIFQDTCLAYKQKSQKHLPIKAKRITIRKRFFHYLIITHHHKVYLKKRTKKDIWQGLYEFYLIEDDSPLPFHELQDELLDAIRKYKNPIQNPSIRYSHQLTHQRLEICFFHILADDKLIHHLNEKKDDYQLAPFTLAEMQALPLPIVLANALPHLLPAQETTWDLSKTKHNRPILPS